MKAVCKPTFDEEQLLSSQGFCYIAGVDEAGRGCLAGPVVAAAVILPPDTNGDWTEQIMDSKLLTMEKREYLYSFISDNAVSCGIGIVSNEIIDVVNILQATKMAMKQAIEQLNPQPDTLLIDFLKLPEVSIPQKGIPHGDGLCFSIACASIVAKVSRDRLMNEMDELYPGYGLCKHKGYWTAEHISCINKLGPCPIHRRTFQPIKGMYLR
ncbi:MAG: ribonuclease HII [Dehalococcoidales bacterium]|nr:ribonuclease HII [Dehalococcoidales bacterium]MDD3994803.1 ribonuclease HII [Dehalococcoidales bacterium]NLT28369.1 ribonuclease HII [Dehalococcoidales bacterium]